MYDWQKISGTTIVQKPQLPGPDDIQKAGLTDFVGAVTDGLYGAVVFDFKSPHDPLEAKKSWFFFDTEYVCLGTDIKSQSGLEVATTLDQSLLRSDVHVQQDGSPQNMAKGSRTLQKVKWVHHDKTGYIFPEPASVNLSNQTETGSWAAITDQKNISKEVVSKDVFKLWYNHGSKPAGASYAYIVVPEVTEKELITTGKNNRSVEILSNTPALQAVRQSKLGISQLAFYKAGNIEIEKGIKVGMDSAGIVMLKTKGGRLKALTVADPSRKLSRISVSVSGIYKNKGEGYTAAADPKQNRTLFTVDLPQGVYLGKSFNLELE